MAIYLKIQSIDGDVTAKGHEKWIEASSIQFGAGIHVSTEVGRVTNRVYGYPYIGDVIITKNADSSSMHLFNNLIQKNAIPEVKIDICSTDKEITPYAQYTLSDVLISDYVEGHSEASTLPQEIISLNFTSIEKSYTPRDAKNKPKSPTKTGYHLETAELM